MGDDYDPLGQWLYAGKPLPFACCPHCGCAPIDRIGHDDTCAMGCNDQLVILEMV